MSFHVYLEPELEYKLQSLCKKTGKKRNAIVREAIREYVDSHLSSEWPAAVFDFIPDKDLPPFENARNEGLIERDDIFGGANK